MHAHLFVFFITRRMVNSSEEIGTIVFLHLIAATVIPAPPPEDCPAKSNPPEVDFKGYVTYTRASNAPSLTE